MIKLAILLVLGVASISGKDVKPKLLQASIFKDAHIYKDAVPYQAALQNESDSGITLPGTKWCGVDDIASDYNDLGTFDDTDKCCRTHDHCPMILHAGETFNNLTNNGLIVKLHCDCEQAFISCLQDVNSLVSIGVGKTYYTAREYCFKLDYPIVGCAEYVGSWFWKRCIRYEFDTTKPQQWQWFDMPYFHRKK